MADEKIGLSDEQQAILDADFQQQKEHQTPGQAYLCCYATNDLPAEAKDAKFALAKIVDDIFNYESEVGKRWERKELSITEYSEVLSITAAARQKITEATVEVTRVFTLLR